MKAFFDKHPMEFTEKVAIKMIHCAIEKAEKKCKKKDPTYVHDLVKAHGMLEDFFIEKGINPEQYP